MVQRPHPAGEGEGGEPLDQPLQEVGLHRPTDGRKRPGDFEKEREDQVSPPYSILRDELFAHMQEHGFTGFQRGELGSTSENLKSLQYQIQKDWKKMVKVQN